MLLDEGEGKQRSQARSRQGPSSSQQGEGRGRRKGRVTLAYVMLETAGKHIMPSKKQHEHKSKKAEMC